MGSHHHLRGTAQGTTFLGSALLLRADQDLATRPTGKLPDPASKPVCQPQRLGGARSPVRLPCIVLKFEFHLFRSIASSVLQICYEHEITHAHDPLLNIVQDALESLRNSPYLVDVFPLRESSAPPNTTLSGHSAVKYYPSWFPGGGFKNDAAEARVISQRLRYAPFGMVRNQMVCASLSANAICYLIHV